MGRHIPKAANFDLLGPDIGVEATSKVIIHDRAILVMNDTVQSIPDKEARDAQSDQYADQWEDGHPLLLWMALSDPRLVDVALIEDAPRMKESLHRLAALTLPA
jgi:hypothetical protein